MLSGGWYLGDLTGQTIYLRGLTLQQAFDCLFIYLDDQIYCSLVGCLTQGHLSHLSKGPLELLKVSPGSTLPFNICVSSVQVFFCNLTTKRTRTGRLLIALDSFAEMGWPDTLGIIQVAWLITTQVMQLTQLFREQPWSCHCSPHLCNRKWLLATQKRIFQH